jgi:hypothetical protein
VQSFTVLPELTLTDSLVQTLISVSGSFLLPFANQLLDSSTSIPRLSSLPESLTSVIDISPSPFGGFATALGNPASPLGRLATALGRLASPLGGLATALGMLASPLGWFATALGMLASPLGGLASLPESLQIGQPTGIFSLVRHLIFNQLYCLTPVCLQQPADTNPFNYGKVF